MLTGDVLLLLLLLWGNGLVFVIGLSCTWTSLCTDPGGVLIVLMTPLAPSSCCCSSAWCLAVPPVTWVNTVQVQRVAIEPSHPTRQPCVSAGMHNNSDGPKVSWLPFCVAHRAALPIVTLELLWYNQPIRRRDKAACTALWHCNSWNIKLFFQVNDWKITSWHTFVAVM